MSIWKECDAASVGFWGFILGGLAYAFVMLFKSPVLPAPVELNVDVRAASQIDIQPYTSIGNILVVDRIKTIPPVHVSATLPSLEGAKEALVAWAEEFRMNDSGIGEDRVPTPDGDCRDTWKRSLVVASRDDCLDRCVGCAWTSETFDLGQ